MTWTRVRKILSTSNKTPKDTKEKLLKILKERCGKLGKKEYESAKIENIRIKKACNPRKIYAFTVKLNEKQQLCFEANLTEGKESIRIQ